MGSGRKSSLKILANFKYILGVFPLLPDWIVVILVWLQNPPTPLPTTARIRCVDALSEFFREFALPQTISLNSLNVGKFLWSGILKDCIKVQEKKKRIVVLCSSPRQNVKLGILEKLHTWGCVFLRARTGKFSLYFKKVHWRWIGRIRGMYNMKCKYE